jgi:hypothetical protein
MSRCFGQQSLDVISIQRAIEYSKRKVSTVALSKNDSRIVVLLSKLPYIIRTVEADTKMYKLVAKTEQFYMDNHIFTNRLPLPMLIHQIAQIMVSEYAPYTGKLVNTHKNKNSKYDILWQRVLEHINPPASETL